MSSTMLLEGTEKGTRLSPSGFVAQFSKSSPEIMDGIRRGIAAVKAGKVQSWEEVKRELGLLCGLLS